MTQTRPPSLIDRTLPGALGWANFFAVSALNVLVGVTLQVLAGPWDAARRTCLWVDHHIWGRLLWRTAPCWRLQVRGAERLPPGPVVIVANHQSVLDIPAILALPTPIRVLAKPSLFSVPVMGWYMRFSRQIPVFEADEAAGLLATCREHLANGVSVLVFPEGTRSEAGEIRRFHRGAFRLALDAGVPVLPVAVRGTEGILRKGSLWSDRWRVDVHVDVLPPIHPEAPGAPTTARALAARCQTEISAAAEAHGWAA